MRGARHHDGRIRVDHLDMRLRDEEVAIGIRRSTDDTNLDLQPTLRHAVAGYGLRGLPIEPDRGEFIRTGHAAVPVLHLAACVFPVVSPSRSTCFQSSTPGRLSTASPRSRRLVAVRLPTPMPRTMVCPSAHVLLIGAMFVVPSGLRVLSSTTVLP